MTAWVNGGYRQITGGAKFLSAGSRGVDQIQYATGLGLINLLEKINAFGDFSGDRLVIGRILVLDLGPAINR